MRVVQKLRFLEIIPVQTLKALRHTRTKKGKKIKKKKRKSNLTSFWPGLWVSAVCAKLGAAGVRFRRPKLVVSHNRFDFGYSFLLFPAFLC